MLKILDRRGTFPVVDLCSVYEKSSTSSCQPRRSQRHGGPTLPNQTTEIPTVEEDRNFLQTLARVGHIETPDVSDEAEPSSESTTLVSAMLSSAPPRRSQRSQKRSRFMDDEYLLLPWIGRATSSDGVKVVVVEQRKNHVGNEPPAVKKRSFKSLSSSETSAKNSPKTAIDSTSPTQKGASRVVTRRSLGPVVRYPIGTRLNVKYGAVNPQIYEAKVIDVDIVPQVPRYRVHYRGWNKSHDSWITRIDVVSVIEKPSSPSSSSSTTGSETTVKPSPDTTPKISTKVFTTDCKLSVSRHKGSGNKDSKIINAAEEEENPDAENKRRKKRKQESEEEEERENGGEESGNVRERQTRSGRRKQQRVDVGLSSTNNDGNAHGEASWSGSDGEIVVAEEMMEVESETRSGTGCVETVAEGGVVAMVASLEVGELEKPLEDGSGRNDQVAEDGEKPSSGAEEEEEVEENGVDGREDGSSGGDEEEEERKEDGSEKENNNGDDNNGDRDNNGGENNGRRNNDNDDDDDNSDDENDGEDDGEDDEKEEKELEEDRDSDSESQSAAPSTHPSSATLVVSLDPKSSTLIYDSIVTSELSSSESESGEPAFGDDIKTMTSDDFLDEETARDDDISVSNSNSDDACNDLCNDLHLPVETDSVRSGATSSITSDHHHHRRRPDSNTTTTLTTTSGSGSQLYDDTAENTTRHFARIHSLPPPSTTSFIDLEAELKGLDETEKEEYILRKMRKIQIEYKQMSSIYNKLTRRSNRASNRRKSRSRRHANSVAIATADTEAPPVC